MSLYDTGVHKDTKGKKKKAVAWKKEPELWLGLTLKWTCAKEEKKPQTFK